jgi:hypothetical protein
MSEKKLNSLLRQDLQYNSDIKKARIRRLRQEAHERLEAARRTDPSVLDALVVAKLLLEVGIYQDAMWRDLVELAVLPK